MKGPDPPLRAAKKVRIDDTRLTVRQYTNFDDIKADEYRMAKSARA